ncbi:hypothetical protein [Flavobacterium laiguense]|uniref:Uncharacterized protein n=1 Tax=Flavobacterium laiguense TaxID=2169409 RepID=A0A2U1JU37_9FLAO|nr:hypothetical protein [Flavobacterium laiguense]PWA08710.1 hypothetical protein DB891_10825 [Flavobacterium laiguense]
MKKNVPIVLIVVGLIVSVYFSSKENAESINNLRFNNATTSIVKTKYKVNLDSILHIYKAIDNKKEATVFLDKLEKYTNELNQKYQASENHKKVVAFEKENIQFMKTKAGSIKKLHPEWSKEDCEKLANNFIWKGMHIDMVKYSKGDPDDVNISNKGFSSEYEYIWKDEGVSHFYTGKESIVVDYD